MDARWLNLSEGPDNLQQAVRLGRQVDDPEAGLGARFWLVQARLGTGQRQEAGLQASVMLTTAEGLCLKEALYSSLNAFAGHDGEIVRRRARLVYTVEFASQLGSHYPRIVIPFIEHGR